MTLFVHSFFPEESEQWDMLKEAASILEERGVRVHCVTDETFLSSGLVHPGDHVLSIVPAVERTGQMALKAFEKGLSGIVVYGDSPFGISLEEGNVVSFFGDKGFHSEMIRTEDGAFPRISKERMKNSKKDPLVKRILMVIYISLMIYGIKGDSGFLSAADEARHIWKERNLSL